LAHLISENEADRSRGTSFEKPDPVARRVLERYAPAHVVVNEDHNVVRASSRTGKYLELAEGAPSTKITDLAKRGLRSAVRAVLESARRTHRRVVKRDVRIEDEDGAMISVDVSADPLSERDILVVFQERGINRADDDGEAQVEGYSEDDRIRQLEDELDETRSRLRSTVEEHETSNQ